MKLRQDIPDTIDTTSPYALWATWFGCGYITPAPGTWGTLGAVPFGMTLYWLGGPILLVIAIFAIIPVGLWSAQEFGKAAEDHDSKMIVIDEVAGMWISMLPAALNPLLLLFSFLAFRFFDIFKPWPISFFDQKMKNAYGVMMDDVVAGLFVCVCILLLKMVM